ncbi:MAG: LamG-like jellyroll fold domain-containing protein, partial [Planctomycetota bacterium]
MRIGRAWVWVCVLVALGLASTASAVDPSLVGWWKLDDGSGTTAADSSGRSVDGTLFGDPAWDTEGIYGGCLLFDGTDDYIFIDGGFQLPEYTMAVWFRVDAPGQRDILSAYAVGVQHGILLELQGDGTLRFLHRLPLGTGGGNNIYTTTTYDEGAWYHAAMVKAVDEIALYVNGEQVGALPDDSTFDPGDSFGLAVGVLDDERGVARLFLGAMDDVRVHDRPLAQEEIQRVMAGAGYDTASDPVPAHEATDVPRDVILAWTGNDAATARDVYFGMTFDDVNDADRANPGDVLVSQGQTETAYDPEGVLEFGQTYYWRIDEINGPPEATIFKGEVWSFTAEPFAYPIEGIVATSNGSSDAGVGPENTINGSGLNENDEHSTVAADMWLAVPGAEPLQVQYEFDAVYKLHEMLVWNYNVQFELMLGFGLKDVTVEYSENGTDWTALGDVQLAQATARADYAANTSVAFNGVPAQSVRLTVNSGYGPMGQFGLSEVRFTSIPVQAREPQPADGADGVGAGTALGWRAGREAVSHDVYLGTDPEALAMVDSVSEASYAPSDLQFGTMYYWQIVEVNEAEAISSWAGDLWSFATQEFAVIDDMESYDDEENRIYDAWLDGFVNNTGATVGYFEAPFAEQTIVNSGGQSMPLEYNNADAPFYSEAELDLGGMDLDGNGADTLRLFVSGQAPPFVETADGSILMNAIGVDIWGTADEFRYVHKSLTGDGSITARVDALDGTPNSWAKGGVMIRQSTEGGAINTYMAMTGGDGGGATYQQRMEADTDSVSQHTYADGPFSPPYWVRVTREGDTLLGYTSPDGETWTQRGDSVTLAMADPVLIGLAVTSHNAGMATSAAFSNVSTTGDVTGGWQMAEIGVAQPTTGNDIAPLYV